MKIIVVILICLSFNAFASATITITGAVTDKFGKPVSKCDVFFNRTEWIKDESIHVTCDENGLYSAEIEPGLYNSVYVCDEEQYGKTALEFWGWNLVLTESQTLDAQFDTLEVFSLSTWASNGGSPSMFASFRPMSLKNDKQPNYTTVQKDKKLLAVIDISPAIDTSSIKGFIDDHPLSLIDFHWVYEKVSSCDGFPNNIDTSDGCYMPMLIAQFAKPALEKGLHTFRLDLKDSENGDFGQGKTSFTSNEFGLGF